MAKALSDYVQEALTTVKEVEPAWVEEWGPQGWLVLDVREESEYDGGHIRGAVNIPRGFLEVKADLEHPKRDPALEDRDQKIICYCGGGHRSALAAKTLKEMGFQDVRSMRGGWTAWVDEDREVDI